MNTQYFDYLEEGQNLYRTYRKPNHNESSCSIAEFSVGNTITS